jgi:multidrug resistance efflux pump
MKHLFVDIGVVLDPRPYQADFDRAAAEFERMQAQLKLAQIELDRAKGIRTNPICATIRGGTSPLVRIVDANLITD